MPAATPDFSFEVLLQNRTNVARILSRFSTRQKNTIPDGFSNNLIWNAGHLVVTQQLLLYSLSGLPMLITDDWVERFRKGTRPEHDLEETEIKKIIDALHAIPTQSQSDVAAGKFDSVDYKTYPTSFGITLHSPEESIAFNNLHEGLHLGAMIALAKKV